MARIKRKTVSVAELNAGVQKMIAGKSDREIAILGGALLEGMLFNLLTSVLVDSPLQKSKGLFDYPKPLSSFGNMLSLAFAFGQISVDEFHLIGVIKRLRDYAAHTTGLAEEGDFCFSKEPVRGMLHDFNPKAALDRVPKEVRTSVVEHFDRMIDFDAKLAYRMIFCLAEVKLLGRLTCAEQLVPPAEINEELEEK